MKTFNIVFCLPVQHNLAQQNATALVDLKALHVI